jgi:sigma-B regulation protein RsbU (phosphoserine phosphatase)
MKSTRPSNPAPDSSAPPGKTRGRLSLRAKLALLIIASLSCALLPVLLIAQRYVEEQTINAEKRNFVNILNVAEENINSNFNNMVASKVGSVLRHKRNLREAAVTFDQLAALRASRQKPPDPALERMRREYEAKLAESGIRVFEFDPLELDAGVSIKGYMPLRAELAGSKGITLARLLRELPPSGYYSVYSLHNMEPEAQPETSLFFFLPHFQAGERRKAENEYPLYVTAAVISLKSLELEEKQREKQLIASTQERFNELALYPGGFIALLDAQGATLAARGDFSRKAELGALFAKAALDGRVESALQLPRADGSSREILIQVEYVRPFGWFLAIAAPMEEIRSPAGKLIRRLTLSGSTAGALALLFSLCLLTRVVKPLRLLTKKIRELPGADFSSKESYSDLAGDLPKNQRDEVGDLARSFSALVENLHLNIQELMEATRAREHMRGELAAARDIQLGMLPSIAPARMDSTFSHAVFLDPAKEVGGDFYDFFETPDGRYAVVIGDVSGKGVPAALFMAVTVTMVRSILGSGLNPAEAMGKINKLLQAYNPSQMFVTLFLGLYEPENRRLEYTNAGHNPPYTILRENGKACAVLEGLGGPMAGVFPGISYELFCRELQKGELCLLYTDGVTEAENTTLEAYGEARLKEYIESRRGASPQELVTGIVEDIKNFRGAADPSDDITMLAFAVNTQTNTGKHNEY